MEIVFVRHGQPEWVREGLNQENPPLTELGHDQAAAMAGVLAHESWDDVFVSPLQRARQTAAPLFAALECDEQIAPWLQEIGDPPWHGTPMQVAQDAYDEIAQRRVEERWDGLNGGESVRDFADRIRREGAEFWAERGMVRTEHGLPVWTIDEPDQRVALVAHTGTNSMALGHLLGIDATPWEWERFVFNHASITRLRSVPAHGGHIFSLVKLSDVEHLNTEQRTR